MAAQNKSIPTERRGFTDIETARLLGMSTATIRRWRLTGQGPKYRKFGGAVRYFVDDIETFIAGAPSGFGALENYPRGALLELPRRGTGFGCEAKRLDIIHAAGVHNV